MRKISNAALFAFIAGFLLHSVYIYAAEKFEVGQRDRQFTKTHMSIKVGDSVTFTNEDDVYHNVFSLSPAKTFDLGAYPKGEGRNVIFDKPGRIEVECSAHPEMLMTIDVK